VKYQPHIDGLRGISVAAVVLYHAVPAAFPGGFVGVDVFFVISGYLITCLILEEIGHDGFSIAAFYNRRIRRIFPAFAFLMLCTSAAAYALFLPAELKAYGADLASAALFALNVTLYATMNYFSAPAELNPLLHLWSLSVEEQFYVVFPFVVLWGVRHRKLAWLLVGLIAVSFVASLVMLSRDPNAAFYLLPLRAWELGIGALVAAVAPGATVRTRFNEAACGAGLLAILGTILFLPANSRVPGYPALLVCVGAAAITHAGGQSAIASRLLASRPLVFTGLISYSLYLWHWPLFAFAKYYLMGALTPLHTVTIIGASVVMSVFSWRVIERPFRRAAAAPQPLVIGSGVAVLLMLAALGGLAHQSGGFPGRLNPAAQAAARYQQERGATLIAGMRSGTCFLDPEQGPDAYDAERCFAKPGTRPDIVLWGDSFAAHYYPGLRAAFETRGISVAQATASACPPFLSYPVGGRPHCEALNTYFFGLIEQLRPRVAILSTAWYGHVGLPPQFDSTLQRLIALNVEVVILGPTPAYRVPVPVILTKMLHWGHPASEVPKQYLWEGVFRNDAEMRAKYVMPHVHYISMVDRICRGGVCPMVMDGRPVHYDGGHFDPAAAVTIVETIKPAIETVLKAAAGQER